jgi:hypothetical protein
VFSGARSTVVASAATVGRSRDGSTCSSFASARALDSSMPVMPVAARSPTATAIASSSSRSNGGNFAPAPSR